MREIRQSGSEGGVTQFNASSLPPMCAVELHNPLRWETSAGLDRIQAENL